MSDLISVKEKVYGYEVLNVARMITPEEGEYRTAQAECEAAWQVYYQDVDRVEDNPDDTFLREVMALDLVKARLADDVAADLYGVWMHSDSEYQNARYLISVS